MKIRLMIVVLAFLFAIPALAQLDRSKRPEPGPAPEIKLGEYETFTLENGLQVFVVENHKLPVVDFRLVLDRDPILEGENAGYASIAGDLLRTGTKNRTKDQIDEEVDFIGASLNTGSTSITGSALKKHAEKLLDIISDILLNYDFKQEELDKLKKQYISNIISNRDDPGSIASTVQNVLLYGKDHPYGEPITEKTVESVTLQMCTDYIDKYFKPNIGYLAIVGDVSLDEAKSYAEKYFSGWKKGEVPKHTYSNPQPPAKTSVAIVDRPASVQSVIHVTYPVYLKLGDPDYFSARLMNTIFGGNSTARLYKNLRETKGFTYGAYSSLESDKLVGNFDASLQARNAVTDSSVAEILSEMKKYREQGADEEELQSIKNYVTGSFARSLESPQTVATFAINSAIYNLPADYYQNYLKNIAAVTVKDVNEAARKYINPENAHILVVGNADEIEKGLAQFGSITYYDIYGNEVDTASAEIPEGLTGDDVIQKYIAAIGGKENLEKVQDRTTEMSGKVQGFEIKMTIYQKAPNLLKQVVDAMGAEQVVVFNGEKGIASAAGNTAEITGDNLVKLKIESSLNFIVELDKHNVNVNLNGIEKIDDKDTYKVEMMLEDSSKWIQYYDVESGLKLKEIKTVSTPGGDFAQETLFSDYREVDGVKYPFKVNQSLGAQKLEFTVNSIKVNTGLSDNLFKVD